MLLGAQNGSQLARVSLPGIGRIRRLAWLFDQSHVAAISCEEGSETGLEASLNLVELDSARIEHIANGPRYVLGRSEFSNDGSSMAVLLSDRIDVYDVRTRRATASVSLGGDSIQAIGFSPDGSLLAIGTLYGEVHFRQAASDGEVAVWNTNSQAPINAVRFLGDGTLVAAQSRRGRFIRIWSLENCEDVMTLPLPVSMSSGAKTREELKHPLWQREPYKFAASVDGSMMAIVENATDNTRQRRTIYLWDGRPETPSQTVPRVRPALISSDGQGKWAP